MGKVNPNANQALKSFFVHMSVLFKPTGKDLKLKKKLNTVAAN